MVNPSRRIATAVLAMAIAGTAGLTALAPGAVAATVSTPVNCVPPPGGGNAFDTTQNVDIVVTPSKATYAVGEKVTVTWAWKSYQNNPGPIRISAGMLQPFGQVNVAGAQTGVVEVTGGKNPQAAEIGSPIILPDMVGELTLSAAGTVDLAPGINRTRPYDTPSYDAICTPTATPQTSTTLKVEVPAPETATLTATPGTVEPGKATSLAGTKWTPGAAATPSLCDGAGANCSTAAISAHTLAIAADGTLSGTATVAAGTADGAYTVQVTDGTKTATAGLNVKKAEVPIPVRKITLSKNDVRPWTFVKVTGENFTPNTLIAVIGLNGTTPVANFSAAWAGADGKFCTWILVTSTKINSISAAEIDTSFKFDKVALSGISVHW
ncbi:hypothetical protein [Yinghuangia soli]|uniref:Uncharacterized protein n=1 Tax=Yinghuangia soli TaxID=2908204 RepID=A0AA41Q8L6_9ACTN|nr:hypothetical protein [Yinghuangia soli]MCF2532910.1 hypothetical protein [Yinghuangia soli]